MRIFFQPTLSVNSLKKKPLFPAGVESMMILPPDTASYSRLEESKQNRLFFFFDGRDARAVPEYISIHIAEKQT
jgi:hypothetical protein